MIDEFTEYLKEQVRNHSIYVWGGQGQQGDEITVKVEGDDEDKVAEQLEAFLKENL